ncbi:hypothetical protein [Williamsia sp. CHRR-6]|uniref:hypothetical protein n=1 Tax=Williamsia sp. CHRR-6 TaxID=2835871 RepID=UPI001BD98DE3|nr:hypothetical protein [Williamsia sp. CHRR-6]MBT0566499.1 hypothetical protein [Williamsia sp. CHRR-6]
MTEILIIDPVVVAELAARQRGAAHQLRALREAIDVGTVAAGLPGSQAAQAAGPLAEVAAAALSDIAHRIDALAQANTAAAQTITLADEDYARRIHQVLERNEHG